MHGHSPPPRLSSFDKLHLGGAEIPISPPVQPYTPIVLEKVGSLHIIIPSTAMSSLVPARQAPRTSVILIALRQASSSSKAPKTVAASSVQRADEQLALRQKQQAALRRSGRQMDIMSASIQVLGMLVLDLGVECVADEVEPTVEPPFEPGWLFKKGFFSYAWNRARSYWGGTRASSVCLTVQSIHTDSVDYCRCADEVQRLPSLRKRHFRV